MTNVEKLMSVADKLIELKKIKLEYKELGLLDDFDGLHVFKLPSELRKHAEISINPNLTLKFRATVYLGAIKIFAIGDTEDECFEREGK